MKKKIILVFVIILLSNLPPLRYVFAFFLNEGLYRYTNSTNAFNRTEIKTYDFAGVKENFEIYKKENPQEKNTKLYRNFYKNPLTFWRYGDYFFDDRYQLPYKNRPENK